jgi:hypothetical protein
MSLGMIFLIIALIVLFLDIVNVIQVPKVVSVALFCITLGLLLGGVPLNFFQR